MLKPMTSQKFDFLVSKLVDWAGWVKAFNPSLLCKALMVLCSPLFHSAI